MKEINDKRISDMLTGLSADDTMSVLEKMREEVMKKQRREACLSQHHSKITCGKDGRWRTRIQTQNGTRMISRASRDELEDALVEHYGKKTMSFRDVFDEWIEEKKDFKEIGESSITRYKNEFKRYFPVNEPFCRIPFDCISESDIELFIKRSISRHSLTKKTYAQLRTLLIGVFRFGKREKYTLLSISAFFKDLDIPDAIFTKKKRLTDEDQVFSMEESSNLLRYLWDNPTIFNLGLILMFETGIRVGELVALTWDHIDREQMSISICATEVSFDRDGKRIFEVSDSAKTDEGNRIIYYPSQAAKTIDALFRLNPFGEYVFMNKNKRIRAKQINYYLKKACREIRIPERSTHKIRKTYASTLITNHVNEKLIQKQLGHTDIATTRKYYDFSLIRDKNVIRQQISNAVTY